MKSFLVIGMGRFGRHLCRKLIELGNEVMAVDENEEALHDLLPIVTQAQVGDCTKLEVLESLGVRNYDTCFVCTGGDFQASLEITSQLKEMGARHVVSKAARELHAKFLLRNGADEIVFPEYDIAEKLAVRHSANQVYDYLQLTEEFSLYEIAPLPAWVGKSILELNFRNRYKATIMAIKQDGKIDSLPSPDHVFEADEHLMIMGRNEDLEKLLKQGPRRYSKA